MNQMNQTNHMNQMHQLGLIDQTVGLDQNHRESDSHKVLSSMAIAAVFMLIVGAFLASNALAFDIRAPFELESTKVLPKKIRNPRVKSVFTSITGRFDPNGIEQPLGAKLNKVISWNDLISAQATDVDKNKIIGVRDAAGLDPNGSPGQTSGTVNAAVQVTAPVLAYGVNERYTLALAVPVYAVRVNQDTGFIRSTDGQKFIDKACESDLDKCNDSAAKLNNAVNEKLKRLGYQPMSNQDYTALGDIRLVGKYVLGNRDTRLGHSTLTLRHELTAPTGLAPNPDNALAIPVGDGQWDIGAGLIHDLTFAKDFRWNGFGSYTAQLPANMLRRLPTSATDSLSADKELVNVDFGDLVTLGTSLNYELPGTGISTGLGYHFQHMAKSSIRNGQYDPSRYRLLENEMQPTRTLHSAIMMAGISTVDFYKQKKFFIPMQTNLAYSMPLSGTNTTTNHMFLAELVMFF